MIITILVVVLIFGLLVFVHELGHFLAARRSGVEVEEFGFGFPPRAYGKKVGRTIYSINWLPLGGFVRLKGEDSADKSKGSFGAAPFRKKLKILTAGVLMNVVTAYVILAGLAYFGIPASVARSLSSAPVAREDAANVLVLGVADGSPAARAGIVKGESIVSINGKVLATDRELTQTTKELAGTKVIMVVRNEDGAKRVIDVQLRDAEEGKKSGYLGVSPFETHEVSYGARSPLVAAEMTWNLLWGTFKGFALGIAGLLRIGGQAGTEAAATVTGPVGIVVLLNNVLQLGLSYVLFFVASISASLAVINILPIPALDGGRTFLLIVQRLSGKTLSPEREALVHMIGFVALIALMIVITVVDVQRLLG
jgi:regulator of sigma E protease